MILKKLWIIPYLISFLILMGVSGLAWTQIPEDKLVAVHWGAYGPDGFANRSGALFSLPKVGLFIFLLYLAVPFLEPRKENFLRSIKAYNVFFLAIFFMIALGQILIITNALGYISDVTMIMCVAFGMLLMVMGNYLGKVRSNFWVGIRTPWTLSSENVWNKTHRLTGWLFVGCGIFMVLAAVTKLAAVLWAFFGILGACIFSILYSFVIWKQEQRHNTKK